jgi:hypothetical protein
MRWLSKPIFISFPLNDEELTASMALANESHDSLPCRPPFIFPLPSHFKRVCLIDYRGR